MKRAISKYILPVLTFLLIAVLVVIYLGGDKYITIYKNMSTEDSITIKYYDLECIQTLGLSESQIRRMLESPINYTKIEDTLVLDFYIYSYANYTYTINTTEQNNTLNIKVVEHLVKNPTRCIKRMRMEINNVDDYNYVNVEIYREYLNTTLFIRSGIVEI